MSIITKRGDDGYTDLMFGKRISKTSLQIATLGTIDELNAALGLARAAQVEGPQTDAIDRIQRLLFALMGQLACLPEDQETYQKKNYATVSEQDLQWLSDLAIEVEKAGVQFTHWAVPGAEGSMVRAHLDFARTISRRAERHVLMLHEQSGQVPETVRLFLNRLSDFLWISARSDKAEKTAL